nr:hypothetical protein [Parvibacter caecicola]
MRVRSRALGSTEKRATRGDRLAPSNRAIGFCAVSHVGDAVGHGHSGHLPLGLGPDRAERLPERRMNVAAHQAFVIWITVHGEKLDFALPVNRPVNLQQSDASGRAHERKARRGAPAGNQNPPAQEM